jgi:photosystem II stability/assembly factor-like uncharacterized protein
MRYRAASFYPSFVNVRGLMTAIHHVSLSQRAWCPWALLVITVFGGIPTSAQTFQSLGPAGGDVRALAADPSHPGTLYLGTTDGDIFGSADAAEHWTKLGQAGNDPAAVVSALVVDQRDSKVLYATTWTREHDGERGGVYVSRDAGRTWNLAGLAGHALRALAQAPSNSDVLIAGGLDGVFLSRDHGANWKRISPEGYAELYNIDSLAFDPTNASVIYAGTFHLPWKTTDSGEHWIAIHDGMIDDSDVLSLAVDPNSPSRIFASACSGIYRSDSAGAEWRKISGIPYTSRRTLALRQDPRSPSDLYAGTTEGLWVSHDGGESWHRTTAADWVINAITIVSEREGARGNEAPHRRIVVGAEQQGILISDDSGEHLRRSNAGFVHQRIASIASGAAGSRSVAILMADWDEPAQISDDGGHTWKSMGNNAAAMGLSQIVATPDGWRATLAGGGLARFNRGADEWVRQGSVLEVPAAKNEPAAAAANTATPVRDFNAKVQELAFGDTDWWAATAEGLFVSEDEGVTWAKVSIGPSDLPVRSVQASADGKKVWIASSGGVVMSADQGKSWTWHDLPMGSGGALRLIRSGEVLLAFSPAGAYASRNEGGSWEKIEQGLPGALVADAVIGPKLWVISIQGDGLYESRDAGGSWLRIQEGSGANGAREPFPVLAATGSIPSIYAGSANDGVFLFDLAFGQP